MSELKETQEVKQDYKEKYALVYPDIKNRVIGYTIGITIISLLLTSISMFITGAFSNINGDIILNARSTISEFGFNLLVSFINFMLLINMSKSIILHTRNIKSMEGLKSFSTTNMWELMKVSILEILISIALYIPIILISILLFYNSIQNINSPHEGPSSKVLLLIAFALQFTLMLFVSSTIDLIFKSSAIEINMRKDDVGIVRDVLKKYKERSRENENILEYTKINAHYILKILVGTLIGVLGSVLISALITPKLIFLPIILMIIFIISSTASFYTLSSIFISERMLSDFLTENYPNIHQEYYHTKNTSPLRKSSEMNKDKFAKFHEEKD